MRFVTVHKSLIELLVSTSGGEIVDLCPFLWVLWYLIKLVSGQKCVTQDWKSDGAINQSFAPSLLAILGQYCIRSSKPIRWRTPLCTNFR